MFSCVPPLNGLPVKVRLSCYGSCAHSNRYMYGGGDNSDTSLKFRQILYKNHERF